MNKFKLIWDVSIGKIIHDIIYFFTLINIHKNILVQNEYVYKDIFFLLLTSNLKFCQLRGPQFLKI